MSNGQWTVAGLLVLLLAMEVLIQPGIRDFFSNLKGHVLA